MRIVLWIIGIVAVILVALALIIMFGLWNFDRQMKSEAKRLLQTAQPASDSVITDADLAPLPEPVQRYLRYTGVVGKRPIQNAVVKQRGRFRMAPGGTWLHFTAHETYTTQPAGFIWRARISMASLPILAVRDYYRSGEGAILAKIGGLITMADERADEASLMRYFNELMWLPTAYLAHNVTWEAVDRNSARATMTDEGMTVSALFTFDDEGRIVNFEAERFSSTTGKMERWATPIDRYGEFEGYRLPVHGTGIWHLDDGDFAYVDLEITDVVYDVDVP